MHPHFHPKCSFLFTPICETHAFSPLFYLKHKFQIIKLNVLCWLVSVLLISNLISCIDELELWLLICYILSTVVSCGFVMVFLYSEMEDGYGGCFMLGFVKWVLLCKVVRMYCVCLAGIRLIQRGGLSSWYMLQRWWLWSGFYEKWWGCVVVVWLESD